MAITTAPVGTTGRISDPPPPRQPRTVTDGYTHVFGNPVRTGTAVGLVLGGGLLGGLGTAGFLRYMQNPWNQPWSHGKIAAVIGGAALAGAFIGTFFAATGSHGPSVGSSSGTRRGFVKTGTETYNSTCTASTTDNKGNTSTTTYPCVKVRDVGYYKNFGATGTLQLGHRVGEFPTLEDARAGASGAGVAFVADEGKVAAYDLTWGGLDQIRSVNVSNAPGLLGYTDLGGSYHSLQGN